MVNSAMGSVHMVTALASILLGLVVIFLPKGRAAHRMAGLFYVFAMLATNLSALLVYNLTGRFNLFHVFALLSLVCILTGLTMPIIRPANWLVRHAYWMAWSYLGLLAAA